jgi:hypothetical protein
MDSPFARHHASSGLSLSGTLKDGALPDALSAATATAPIWMNTSCGRSVRIAFCNPKSRIH